MNYGKKKYGTINNSATSLILASQLPAQLSKYETFRKVSEEETGWGSEEASSNLFAGQ